nr:DEAD/DEAH box helicase [Acidobacteriota bacterium]
MLVAAQAKRFFSARIRERGESYLRAGAVHLCLEQPQQVAALVTGTDIYDVVVVREGETLRATCDCPYAASGEACKHLWAVLLAASLKGLLGGTPPLARLEIVEAEELLGTAAPVRRSHDEPDFVVDWGDGGAWGVDLPPSRRSFGTRPGPRRAAAHGSAQLLPAAAWRDARRMLESLAARAAPLHLSRAPFRIEYLLDLPATLAGADLVLETQRRLRRTDGSWGAPRPVRLTRAEIAALGDADRRLLGLLLEQDLRARGWFPAREDADGRLGVPRSACLPDGLLELVLPLLCATGRLGIKSPGSSAGAPALSWDDGPPWELKLTLRAAPRADGYVVAASLARGSEDLPLAEVTLVHQAGFVIARGRIGRLSGGSALPLLFDLVAEGPLLLPAREAPRWVDSLLALPAGPRLDLPEDLSPRELRARPEPRLRVRSPERGRGGERLAGEISFAYDGEEVAMDHPSPAVPRPGRRLVVRDLEAERAALDGLAAHGWRLEPHAARGGSPAHVSIAAPRFAASVAPLLAEGWRVEAEGLRYRAARGVTVAVTTGIDWFELNGSAQFGDAEVLLPQLLAALRGGERMVRLGDGSFGILPEEWLDRYAPLAEFGRAEGGTVRFARSQAALLDALLAALPDAKCDDTFARLRAGLARFTGIAPADAPPGFVGTLRGYQAEGLGWLEFLREFGFGGCLADDMGLGKTVQVLALLARHRAVRGDAVRRPALVVAPRSLIFNWIEEARRFVPALRVCDHTGTARAADGDFSGYDLVLTTYGTLRRDIERLRKVPFEYAILDEAQAIKNPRSEAAKAARLLRAEHRLALSGTPIENHLGELWSLFEFLNPGMLGSAAVFGRFAARARQIEREDGALLARALRPFVLRRTKAQVARELPERTEQTLSCELDPVQRALYDELRDHYRAGLLARAAGADFGRMKFEILEALLRLRQAACHPGLIDPGRAGQASAKLELLLPRLEELREEGHKALVFSQFTSLLDLLRRPLDEAAVPYAYLDGQTPAARRRAEVQRFQEDPACPLFLISLKAGGLGLNLTAAEYVYLLDPWWNPAVEAQAIDRAHRIGQRRKVIAYRLIARDTVEERILELQAEKRALADA